MRIVFMGTPDFSVPILDALVDAGHEIAAVYCQPPRPAGRGKKDRPTPVHARANALGLPVYHPVSLRTPEAQAEFAAHQAEVAVVVAYGLILPQAVLDAPEKRMSEHPRQSAAPLAGRCPNSPRDYGW
jgi:methionyl-tRNA formyltransferase